MNTMRFFISAVLGGIIVALGSAASLLMSEQSAIASALLFASGFLAVAILDLSIFTDKVSAIFIKGNTDRQLMRIITVLIGNLIGAFAIGVATIPMFNAEAKAMANIKLASSPAAILIGSVFCGMLIYVGMHGYRKAGGGFTGCSVLIAAVSVISVCGFDYSLANAFCISSAFNSFANYTNNAAYALLLTMGVALGNAIGAIFFSLIYKIKNSENSDHQTHHHKHSSHHHSHHSHHEESEKQA